MSWLDNITRLHIRSYKALLVLPRWARILTKSIEFISNKSDPFNLFIYHSSRFGFTIYHFLVYRLNQRLTVVWVDQAQLLSLFSGSSITVNCHLYHHVSLHNQYSHVRNICIDPDLIKSKYFEISFERGAFCEHKQIGSAIL